MAFVSLCPKCKKNFRVPHTAIGTTMECPACFQEFRVIPNGPAEGSAMEPASSKAPINEESGVELLRAIRAQEGSTREPSPERPSYSSSRRRHAPGEGKILENFPGLVAIGLASLALGAAQVPLVEYLTGPLSVSGLVAAVFAVLYCPGNWARRSILPGVGVAIALPTLVILIYDPNWFRETRQRPDPELPRDKFLLVTPGERPFPPEKEGEPVNASQYAIQRNDIRVAVGLVRYRHEYYVQNNQRKRTKDPKIYLVLRVHNAGLEKPFEFASWKTYEGGPKLFDDTGIQLAEWVPPKGTALKLVPTRPVFPGQTIEEEFVFDPPTMQFKELKLELPAPAFGEKEGVITLKIPLQLISS